MGTTGSGKTKFINTISGANFAVGHDLKSCTTEIQYKSFKLDDEWITLIDTPGFDDTERPQADILKQIATFLEISFEKGKRLAGVIYIHRISDRRMSGVSMENFRLFRKICGDAAMQNVVIVTNMWAEVDAKIGASREDQLKNIYFKDAFSHGARMRRHDDDVDSARSILLDLLCETPQALQVQEEMVVQHKSIPETAAGTELLNELSKEAQKHQNEIEELRNELDKELGEGCEPGEQGDTELRAKVARLEKTLEKVKQERDKLQMAVAQDLVTLWTKRVEEATYWKSQAPNETINSEDSADPEPNPDEKKEKDQTSTRTVSWWRRWFCCGA